MPLMMPITKVSVSQFNLKQGADEQKTKLNMVHDVDDCLEQGG